MRLEKSRFGNIFFNIINDLVIGKCKNYSGDEFYLDIEFNYIKRFKHRKSLNFNDNYFL